MDFRHALVWELLAALETLEIGIEVEISGHIDGCHREPEAVKNGCPHPGTPAALDTAWAKGSIRCDHVPGVGALFRTRCLRPIHVVHV